MIQLSLRIHTRPVLVVAGGLMVLVLVASFVLQLVAHFFGRDHIFGLLPLFNIDREANLAAWLSSTTMLLLALIAFCIAGSNQRTRRAWRWLALIFFLMAMDEGAQLHERIGDFLRPAIPNVDAFFYAWTAPALVALVLVLPLLIRILKELKSATRWRLFAGIGVFLAGALGVEVITGV